MGNLYGHTKEIDLTFHYTQAAPMDDRLGGVKSRSDLDNIKPYKSLIVYVEDDRTYYQYVLQDDGTYGWQEADFGGSGEIPGNYLQILLALQQEVAKLRNSFLYGITSYQGTDTAAGRVVNGMQVIDDKEPLWAIEEDDLALNYLSDLEFDTLKPDLTPLNGTTLDVTTLGKVGIVDAYWEDSLELLKQDTDAKHLLYMATSGDDITLELTNSDNSKTYNVSLKDLTNLSVESYHYLIIISRLKDSKGSRYVYISIDNNTNGLNLTKGYYSGNTLSDSISTLDDDYHINRIYFKNLNLTKLNFYTKYLDFSNEVISSAPKEQDYKYSAAHITVREVANDTELEEVKDHLLTPELVWVADTHTLKINTTDGVYTVGSSSNNEHTEMEIKTALQTMGIAANTAGNLELNPVASITFVASDGNKYTTTLDSEGKVLTVKANEISLSSLVEKTASQQYPTNITGGSTFGVSANYTRGFIAKTLYALKPDTAKNNEDWGLHSDRLKIGAFYMNCTDISNPSYGCSHAYVELENTSDTDIPLDGCVLAFTKPITVSGAVQQLTITLPLTGTIKKNSTYLIRGVKYIDYDDAVIKVKTYDQEWLELDTLVASSLKASGTIGFLLYYNIGTIDLTSTAFVTANTKENLPNIGIVSSDSNLEAFPYNYDYRYIDSTGICVGSYKWFPLTKYTIVANAIYKNTFELDPAKQAFQALTTKDSSRVRNVKPTDCMTIPLDNPNITFNKTFASYPIEHFTPKASFENKTVCTDKTQFDCEKPNMVTCSFGINIHTTRCFNWISAGNQHEFVFIKNSDGTWARFESYGGTDKDSADNGWTKKTDLTDNEKIIYNRMTGTFPATSIQYTGHKCIINHTAVSEPTTFTYVVGRADNDGNPDSNHSSEEYTFTLYPTSYTPRVYQITDQQGFHWVEYQVWSITALELNKRILSDCANETIIPILINTGDMTQNGTRINEWLDYYNAGLPLFKHLEQMNVVGNNDLCTADPETLGTGDDFGKINPYYFHLFYCYEQPDPDKFIINGKYVPSTYYFGNTSYKYLMVNSEITLNTCYYVYGLGTSKDASINIYTGYKVYTDSTEQTYDASTFTPIYNTLYSWLSDTSVRWLPCCHEMPFTVITAANLANGTETTSRSINNSNGNLVGSHLNQLNQYDKKGSYWFSRLLEFYGIKLCIGGHKHTYVCTFPLRENFTWNSGTSSSALAQYTMPATLESDSVDWTFTDTKLSNKQFSGTKIPYTSAAAEPETLDTAKIYPVRLITASLNMVTYLMCQASGYKVKSNKELPATSQLFSKIVAGTDDTSSSAAAQVSLLYPMYCIIKADSSKKLKAVLVRLGNIFTISASKNSESFNIQSDNSSSIITQQLDASDVTKMACLDNDTEDGNGFKYNEDGTSKSLWKDCKTTEDYYIYSE